MSASMPTPTTNRPHPCCVPSKQRAESFAVSKILSEQRRRVTAGSTAAMTKLEGGPFLMGTETDEGFPADGEGPVREVTLDPFYLDTFPVTYRQFREFVKGADYNTESERFGWSFVFHNQLPPEKYRALVEDTVAGHGHRDRVRLRLQVATRIVGERFQKVRRPTARQSPNPVTTRRRVPDPNGSTQYRRLHQWQHVDVSTC
jgi:formylglycine-generating enzyme required for sulfatase activity